MWARNGLRRCVCFTDCYARPWVARECSDVARSTLSENVWKGIGFALGAAVVSAGLTAIAFAVQAAWMRARQQKAIETSTTSTTGVYP